MLKVLKISTLKRTSNIFKVGKKILKPSHWWHSGACIVDLKHISFLLLLLCLYCWVWTSTFLLGGQPYKHRVEAIKCRQCYSSISACGDFLLNISQNCQVEAWQFHKIWTRAKILQFQRRIHASAKHL